MSFELNATTSRDLLTALIAEDTTSRLPNRALMDYVAAVLKRHDIDCTLIPNDDGSKANLYCTVGPSDVPGVMLSGHTDVVPVDGQDWTRAPFELSESDGRLYGRGTADMKGFVAAAIAAAIKASKRSLKRPLHLGFSFDEEIGCVGVRSMIDLLKSAPIRPAMCIVGEPTQLQVATQHKGKMSITATCVGQEAHSALAPTALNAIHLATDFVQVLRDTQKEIQENTQLPIKDSSDVPYTTVHVGNIIADQALNIVANRCLVHFEIRYTSEQNPEALLASIQQRAGEIVADAKSFSENAAIEFDVWNAYPGLDTPTDDPVVTFVKSLVGANTTTFVAFGTEAGLFSERLGIPTVVCGPGSMEQGHKPDEYIEIDQLNRCDAMLEKLIDYLASDQHP